MRSLTFTAPRSVEVQEHPPLSPSDDELLVKTRCSAISAGTELMIYRGEAPKGLEADTVLPSLPGTLEFPLSYGYSAVGEVISAGGSAPAELVGRTVFAFRPHVSQFVATAAELVPLPAELDAEAALFLPNLETAVNFAHDGAPLAGERAVVFGQGVVGLLTTALLGLYPLDTLIAVDPLDPRRDLALELGAHTALKPNELAPYAEIADVCFELSGVPEALDQALSVTADNGRVVVGSWYGEKPSTLHLGGRYHRSRIQIVSSQVSTIAPALLGRWTKPRRIGYAVRMLQVLRPERLISHHFPIGEAAAAYELLDRSPDQALQVVLTY